MLEPVLEGVTVLEFGAGSHASSLAGVLLADNGARVIKVESPQGDQLRHDAHSAHLVLNRGKESMVADLRTAEGRARAQELSARADVVITAFEPGVAEEFGVDYASLREQNPGLVHCSISGFGPTGPYSKIKAYEHVVQAKAGVMSLGQGGVFGYRPGPIFGSASYASTGAGHLAASGVVAALIAREQTGRGQHLDVPMFLGAAATDYFGLMHWLVSSGKVEAKKTSSSSGGNVTASRLNFMPCTKDGRYVFFTSLLPKQARETVKAMGIGHLIEDPRFANMPFFDSAEEAQEYEDLVWDAFRKRTFAEWDTILRSNPDVAYELVRTCEEALDHPQVIANGDVTELDDPEVGRVKQIGPVAHFTQTPARITRSAPALGENTGEALPEPKPLAPGRDLAHPLAGFTLVEFGYFFAMPFGSTMAAALGARVIKIEDAKGDPMRVSFGVRESGAVRVMEGKESISVDLGTAEGRQVVHDIVAKADAFLNGFRPGVAERNGVDYETLKKVNPDLVYVHAAGYGVEGEFANRPIYAQCAQALAGGINRQAAFWLDPAMAEGMEAPEIQAVILPRTRCVADGDSNAAVAVLSALTLALYHKARTGRGQFLSTSMLGGNLWGYADDAVSYDGKTPARQADPEFHGFNALYRLYEAAEGWVFLAAPRQDEWLQLCSVLDRPDLTSDPRFTTAADRAENDDELVAELEQTFATRSAAQWEEMLVPHGVACVRAAETTISEFAASDPHVYAAGLSAEVDHPAFGPIRRHGLPVQFSDTPGRLAPGCLRGQHTHSILTELGYDGDRIAQLEAAGAVFGQATD